MIFSNSTREIYWILSILLKNYDLSIINEIIRIKRLLEDEDNSKWYIEQGVKLNKLRIIDYKELFIKRILFDAHSESVDNMRNIHIKIFHLKIIFNTFSLYGFILNYHDLTKEYSIPNIRERVETLNYYIENHGIYEIFSHIFQYKANNLTDLEGNKCIRSIIRNKIDENIIYEYKTIAMIDNRFIDPIERLPMLM